MKFSIMKLIAHVILASSTFAMCVSTTHADTPSITEEASFVNTATTIKTALSHQKYELITPYIHPTQGVRFSMYAYVNPDKDKRFSQAEFKKYLKHARIKFTWGEKDGTGDLYVETLPNYLNDWVVRQHEFEHAKLYVNAFKGHGNSLNNLTEQYPDANFVEFYHQGTACWDYMDWRALRLVFQTYQGRPYLIAIITDEWTI